MFKLFPRKKDKAAITESSPKTEPESIVIYNYKEDYIDVLFNEEIANKTDGEYIFDYNLAHEKLEKPVEENAEFIKYSIIEFAFDSFDYISKGDTIFVV